MQATTERMRPNQLLAFALVPVLITVTASDVLDTTKRNSFYFEHWCGGDLEYLDDSKCVKKFPTNNARDFHCPISTQTTADLPAGYQPDQPFSRIDVHPLSVVTNGADACVILTRRVDGVPYNKYYCTPQSSAYETWSSSKIFAMANAAGTLRGRETTTCVPAGMLGIDSHTNGKASDTLLLGDLATIICSYDRTAGYTSNSLSSYFHDLGWREKIHDLVQSNWLGDLSVSLGGNYGEATPGDLGFRLTSNSNGDVSCDAIDKPLNSTPKYENSLTALAAAEMTRRLVLHDAVDPSLRFPYLTSADARTILQGADYTAYANATLFPLQMGGMSADTSIFLQSHLDMNSVEEASQGNWRIYSKLGCGYSSDRKVGEIVTNVYACLPGTFGVELTVHVRGSVPGDSGITQVEAVVHDAIGAIVKGLKDGSIV